MRAARPTAPAAGPAATGIPTTALVTAVLVTAVLVTAVLAGCAPVGPAAPPEQAAGGTATPPPLEDPARADRPAEPVEVLDVAVPDSFADAVPVTPGWTSRPIEVGGTFVGVRDDGDAEQVIAVDAAGTVLWEARRPTGTRLVATQADAQPVLVLAHEDAAGATVAQAVDPALGTTLWGPLETPGPQVGPGLVVDDGGQRRALDPASGGRVEAEGAVVLERDGLVLLDDGASLRAVPASQPGASATWSVRRTDLGLAGEGALAAVADAVPPAGTALVGAPGGAGDRPALGTLLDLADGTVLAADVLDARADAALGTVVALAPGRLSGHARGPGDRSGVLWSRAVPDGTRLAASTGALAYLRVDGAAHDDAVLVVNTQTGADAIAYDEPGGRRLAVPALTSSTGAVVVRTDRWLLLTVAR